ncbi:HigA family addiction module antidote protein [candidate division KSB1 bacterium]|nr:HigA family addiction module antidote protein [candidate division KSB1 bacterium]
MLPQNRRPIHPGEILRYEFLEPLKLTQQKLAAKIGVTRVRINEIIFGKRKITPDMAFRLSKYFNTSPDFWMNLQMNIDMWDTFQSYKNEYDNIESISELVHSNVQATN